jgi:hypothetical protein
MPSNNFNFLILFSLLNNIFHLLPMLRSNLRMSYRIILKAYYFLSRSKEITKMVRYCVPMFQTSSHLLRMASSTSGRPRGALLQLGSLRRGGDRLSVQTTGFFSKHPTNLQGHVWPRGASPRYGFQLEGLAPRLRGLGDGRAVGLMVRGGGKGGVSERERGWERERERGGGSGAG